jgi:hypothetical protein
MVKKRILVPLAVALAFGMAGLAWSRIGPSNQRDWSTGQERLPYTQFGRDSVVITNVRNFDYDSAGNVRAPNYVSRQIDLNSIESVWFVLAPFETDNRGPAHSFLSFGFADSQYLSISVEARREADESYSILKGMLNRYEIMYVVGTESDLIRLRVARGDDVYLYPIKTSKDKVRRLFVEMLQRANELSTRPEFYNTLTNNCTTSILEHVNAFASRKIPYGREVLLPGYADELARELGLIDTDLPIEEARKRFHINARAKRVFYDTANFSKRIRDAEDNF